MNDQYYILIRKLDQFIRKYYKNQLIRGFILFIALILLFFLLISLAEYLGRFNTSVRTVLFYTYLFLNLLVFVRYILFPGIKLFRIGKVISHDDAAGIIGKHFPEVRDKLLNTLQLHRQKETTTGNEELIRASIEQKIKHLKPIPFPLAINYRENRKYLKYPLFPILILLFFLLISPGWITEPADRLVHHQRTFENPLPYQLHVLNEDLTVIQHEDFLLEVKVEGEEVPDHILVEFGNNRQRLKKESTVQFEHRFANVQENISFRLIAGKLTTPEYVLTVLPKPLILDFEIALDYPSYTGKSDETIRNNGDLIVPEGTRIGWKFTTKNADQVIMRFNGEPKPLDSENRHVFNFEESFYKDVEYSIATENEFLRNKDSLVYSISVIEDLYPVISVEEYRDSVFSKQIYYNGIVKDDYGFKRLTYTIVDAQGQIVTRDTLPLRTNMNPQQYNYFADLSSLPLQPGQQLTCYFQVWDNDRINGSKSTRSQTMQIQLPTLKEVEEEKEAENENIKDEMEQTLKSMEELQRDVERMTNKLVNKKDLNWEDKEQVKELLNKQEEIRSKIEEIKKQNETKSLKEQQYREVNEEVLQKQERLEELMEKLMQNEALKELFDELQELMEENNKDRVKEMLEEMQLSNEEMEKMLDRNLELFKQLEFEQKLDETIDKLEDLAKEQQELGEQSSDRKNDMEDLKEEQEKVNEAFEDVQEDLDKLDALNEDLESPNEYDPMEEQQQEVEEEMEKSMEQLQNNKRGKASESQQKSSEKMQQMAESLTAMQQQMLQQGMAEDIESLRDILENLIQISFDQEELIGNINDTRINDPRYTSLIQDQNNIREELKLVEDSLFALSKRQIMIEPFVTKEVTEINRNIDRALEYLNNRQIQPATSRQQFVMTSVNNLALMLSESLEQMMSSMAMPSNTCKNPGQSNPSQGQNSLKSIRQLQEQLNQQIERMKMGQEKPGQEKGGKQGQSQSMSEQLARTAAQQEYIRNELRKMAEQLEKDGQFGPGKDLKRLADDMEKTETELVNKMLTEETLMRQKQILTRLLESEKAEMEREKEEKRESVEGKNVFLRNPDELFKYKKVQKTDVELLQPVPPGLTPFYKDKVNQYFFNFDELLEQ